MSEDRELKPCPFCGEAAELDTKQGFINFKHRLSSRVAVYCTGCNADMGVCEEDVPDVSSEMVIEMWNTRANWQKANPEREQMIAMLKRYTKFMYECLSQFYGEHGRIPTDDEAIDQFLLQESQREAGELMPATPAPDRDMLKRFYYFIDTGFHGAGSLDAVVDKFIAQEITLPKQEG